MLVVLSLFAISMALATRMEDAEENPTTRVPPTLTSILVEVGAMEHPVRSIAADHLTDEEFYSRYAAITGQTLDWVISHQEADEERTGYRTFYKEYVLRTELEEGKWVRAGVLAQIEQFRFGQSVVNRFKNIFDQTTYLVKETGKSLVVANYVKGTIQASGKLQLSFSGYTEDGVNVGSRSGLFTHGERREARVPLLSEIGESAVDHWYDRQHVSGSGIFSPG